MYIVKLFFGYFFGGYKFYCVIVCLVCVFFYGWFKLENVVDDCCVFYEVVVFGDQCRVYVFYFNFDCRFVGNYFGGVFGDVFFKSRIYMNDFGFIGFVLCENQQKIEKNEW